MLIDQASSLLPRIKITELMMDVDEWIGFTNDFVHLKSGAQVQDKTLLLSAILADVINLGLTKMAESSPGASYSKLSWLQVWHIRDETYSAGLAIWSTPSWATHSPGTGATAAPHRQMGGASALAAVLRARATSIRSMAPNRER
jgi:hypothetical protein